MARKSALVVAGVNIAAEPPHSPNLYKDVITYIKNNKIIGIFGNERLEIESFSIDYENYIIDVTFSRYYYIDPQKPWWDSNRGQKILDEQGNPIPQVEEGKGPNQKSILFSFNLNNHKLLIDEKNITINSFKKAFESMLCNKNLTDTFGTINITKIPTQDIITYILSIHKLKKIYFKLTIPNPDLTSNPQLEADIFQRFQNINAGSIEGSIRACLETSAFIVTRRHVDKKRLCAAAKTREDCQTVPQRSDGQRMGACTSSPAPCFWRRSEAQNRPA